MTGPQRMLVQGAEARWQNSVGAFEDALKVQAGRSRQYRGTRGAIDSLVAASQSATGALQAAQAGNQLLAVQAQQLADLTATVACARARAIARRRQRKRQPRRRRANSCAGSLAIAGPMSRAMPGCSGTEAMDSKLFARIGAGAFVAIAITMAVLELREEPAPPPDNVTAAG